MKEQPIKKNRYIFEILNPLANSGHQLILSVITFSLHKIKIDFKSGHFRKNRVKKTTKLMTSSRDENVIKHFFRYFKPLPSRPGV